jgi:hypothetical protein
MRPDHLFTKDLRELLEHRRRHMAETIERWPADGLLSTPTADLVARLVEDFGLQPLRLLTDRTEQLPTKEVQVDVSQDQLRFIDDRSRPFYLPGSSISVTIPYDGDPELFTMQASTRLLRHVNGLIEGNELVITYIGIDPTAEQVKASIDSELSLIARNVEFVNNDVAQFSAQLPHEAKTLVEQRKAKLLRDRGLEGALGIPVRRRPGAPPTPVPVRRKRLGLHRTTTPAQPYQDEYALEQANYEEILDIIQGMGRMLERSPRTFAKLSEEELRDHILLQLNGTFEGQAGGELFNGAGKTDILVRVVDRNAFIGECKFWKGEKGFRGAVDQLLGYLVWRDTKAALVLFIRQHNATAVIDKAEQALRLHPNFKRAGSTSADPHQRRDLILHQTGDPNREIALALLPVVIRQPSEPAMQRTTDGHEERS